jgi:hypothetical protein
MEEEKQEIAVEEIKELTIQEILFALAQFPLAPIAICEPGCEPVSDVIEGIDFDGERVMAEHTSYPPEWIKLILKPIDKMSAEDSIEVAVAFLGEKHRERIVPFQGKDFAKTLFTNELEFSPNEYLDLISILRNKGYETKPPFGKSHWAHSKSYFDLGLAIECGPAEVPTVVAAPVTE